MSTQNPGSVMKKPKQSKYAFLIVLSGIIFTGVPGAMIYSCAGIFFSPVSEYFHVSKAAVAGYFSALNITMMVALPIAGKLMSKFDLRIVLTCCALLSGMGCLSISFMSAVWQFYIAGVVMGIGLPALLYLAVPAMINAWFKVKVGFLTGLCMAFTGIGGVIFNQLGTVLIRTGHDGWRRGYLVFGLIILVVTLPFTIFIVRSDPSEKCLAPYGSERTEADNEPELQTKGVMAPRAMRTSAFIALAGFCGIITMNQTVYQFLPSYAYSFQSSAPQIATLTGLIASCCMAGQAIGKVFLGAANDRSIIGGMGMGIGCGILGVALMALMPTIAPVLLLGSFAFGFAYAFPSVQTPLLVRAVFGSKDYTNIYSRVQMVGVLASAFAALFWGTIVDMPHGYAIMFALSAVCMIITFVLGAWALKQRPKLKALME